MDQSKGNRSTTAAGETKLGAILVLGTAGAAAGAIAAVLFGHGFLGIVAGYVACGIAATVLAAVAFYLCDQLNGGDG